MSKKDFKFWEAVTLWVFWVVLMLIGFGLDRAEAAELRIPLYSTSHHTKPVCGNCQKYNESHPMAGIEILHNSVVYGVHRYIDSYNELSIAFYSGQEFAYKGVFVGYHAGATEKGIVYPGSEVVTPGWVPMLTGFVGVKFGSVHTLAGWVPVPEKMGSSLAYVRFSFRIGEL